MSAALMEARTWAVELEKRERFRTDGTRESARYHLAEKTGVPFSYLTRLRYKWRDMNGVDGDAYRNLRAAYEAACERIERRADHHRTITERIEHGDTNGERRRSAGL